MQTAILPKNRTIQLNERLWAILLPYFVDQEQFRKQRGELLYNIVQLLLKADIDTL